MVSKTKTSPLGSAHRQGASLVELLVVLAILGAGTAILLPSLQASRGRARELTCRNHLRQLALALRQFQDIHRRIPPPAPRNRAGGWAVEILPWLGEQPLHDSLAKSGVQQSSIDEIRYPAVFSCPDAMDEDFADDRADYVLLLDSWDCRAGDSVYWLLRDAPLDSGTAWLHSPERMRQEHSSTKKSPGPHTQGAFNVATPKPEVRLVQ